MERGKTFVVVMVAALIFLTVVLEVAIVDDRNRRTVGQWTLALNPPVNESDHVLQSRSVSDNGFLYVASGKMINCLGPHGLVWSATPPDPSTIMAYCDRWYVRGAAYDDGRSYILITPGTAELTGNKAELIAVSQRGDVLWARSLDDVRDMSVAAAGGNVYLHQGNNETVLGRDGSLRWYLEGVDYIPAVDPAGNIYLIRIVVGGTLIEGYRPDGTQNWSRSLKDAVGDTLKNGIDTFPIYSNGTLYVWLSHGLAAFGTDGSLEWSKRFNDSFWWPSEEISSDSNGNVYVLHSYDYYNNSWDYVTVVNGSQVLVHDDSTDVHVHYVSVIGPDGRETRIDSADRVFWSSAIGDGIAYVTNGWSVATDGGPLDQFAPPWVAAYDVLSGDLLWNFTLPDHVRHRVTLDASNIWYLMPDNAYGAFTINKDTPEIWYQYSGLSYSNVTNRGMSRVSIYCGRDATYVDYWAYNYEFPPFFGLADIVYTGGLFALDKTGRLLWSRPTDAYISEVSENNGTVFFATGDGKFSAVSTDIAAGLIAAAGYLLIRFLGLGTVARARSRLEKNGNRNAILELIAREPGQTLHEIARGAGLNVGTVRYHLFILSANHKIATHTDGTKFVRYFVNAYRYTEEEKLIIGLLRREPVRKVLLAMAGRPELTNGEIAEQAGMQESAVSKYLVEAYALGVIRKTSVHGEKTRYSLVEKYVPTVSGALKGFNAPAPDGTRASATGPSAVTTKTPFG